MIIILKLVTEAPRDWMCLWHTRLEKLLVDIMAEPLLLASISENEYPNIFEDAFSKYLIDENCMFRYAKRRKKDKKIRETIREETNIKLRMEK